MAGQRDTGRARLRHFRRVSKAANAGVRRGGDVLAGILEDAMAADNSVNNKSCSCECSHDTRTADGR